MRNTRRRGSSLIEVMIASMVLITGMTGIMVLVIKGMSIGRDSNVAFTAANIATATLSDMASVPTTALSVGTFDGGMATDSDGRRYPRTIVVTNASDGGIAAWRVDVRVEYGDTVYLQRMGTLAPHVATASTIVSERPDANF